MNPTTTNRTPGRLAARAISLGLALLLGASLLTFVKAMAAEPWVQLALRIETTTGSLDMPAALRDRLTRRVETPVSGACYYDLAESRVTIGMDMLRRTVAEGAPASSPQAATSTAQGLVRQALACNPSDANLWYVLALLDYRASAGWDRVSELLTMSASLSPGEGSLILKRARLLAVALRDPAVELPDLLRLDLGHAIADLKIAPAAAILSALRSGGRDAMAQALTTGLPEERQAALAAGTDFRRSTFGKSERYRHFEFRPFASP